MCEHRAVAVRRDSTLDDEPTAHDAMHVNAFMVEYGATAHAARQLEFCREAGARRPHFAAIRIVWKPFEYRARRDGQVEVEVPSDPGAGFLVEFHVLHRAVTD